MSNHQTLKFHKKRNLEISDAYMTRKNDVAQNVVDRIFVPMASTRQFARIVPGVNYVRTSRLCTCQFKFIIGYVCVVTNQT